MHLPSLSLRSGLIKFTLAATFLLSPVCASQIIWRSPLDLVKTNYLSDGSTEMENDFQFQLGAFLNEFIPTAENVDEWNQHWVAADSSPYNATTHLFASSVILENNAAPFQVNRDAYIWGFTGKHGTQEWILLKHQDWKWPASNGGIGFPINWNVDPATVAVVGDVHGPDFVMKSDQVHINSTASPADQWLATNFTSEQLQNTKISGWNANPDGDESTNLFEFLAGSDPFSPDPSPVAVSRSKLTITLTVALSEIALDAVTLTLQFSPNLKDWTDTDAVPEISSGVAAFSHTGEGFVRLHAALK